MHKRNAPKIIVKFAIFSKNHVSISVVSYTPRLGSWITYSSPLLGVAKCYKIQKDLNITRTDFMCALIITNVNQYKPINNQVL